MMNEREYRKMKEIFNSESMQTLIGKGIELGIEAGKSIIVAVVIYFVGKALISLVNRMLSGMMERRNVDPAIQSFVKSLANILLMILLAISVVSALGVNTTSFAALLASGGVAVGMALSGNLQNLAGGIVILLFRPFKVGDYIEAQGTGGTVSEIQIFHTILTTPDNKKIYLPNGALSSGNITNYSKEPLRRVDFTVAVEYGEDIDKVRKALKNILEKDARVLQEPAPVIVLGALADSSVNMTVRVWVKSEDYWNVFFETNETIYNEFNRQGINFPYPQLTIHQG
jgi:small conductance mechanosensitive channel